MRRLLFVAVWLGGVASATPPASRWQHKVAARRLMRPLAHCRDHDALESLLCDEPICVAELHARATKPRIEAVTTIRGAGRDGSYVRELWSIVPGACVGRGVGVSGVNGAAVSEVRALELDEAPLSLDEMIESLNALPSGVNDEAPNGGIRHGRAADTASRLLLVANERTSGRSAVTDAYELVPIVRQPQPLVPGRPSRHAAVVFSRAEGISFGRVAESEDIEAWLVDEIGAPRRTSFPDTFLAETSRGVALYASYDAKADATRWLLAVADLDDPGTTRILGWAGDMLIVASHDWKSLYVATRDGRSWRLRVPEVVEHATLDARGLVLDRFSAEPLVIRVDDLARQTKP